MIRKQAEYRACFFISWYNELLYFTDDCVFHLARYTETIFSKFEAK